MLPWWMWFVIPIGALIFGAMLGALIYLGFSKFYDWKIKRQLPGKGKDKKANSEWIKENKDVLKDGGPLQPQDKMEVQKNESRKREKFREFEKLRRISQQSKSESSVPTSSGREQERRIVQDKVAKRDELAELPDIDDDELN